MKHLLDTADLSSHDIEDLLAQATTYHASVTRQRQYQSDLLKGTTQIQIFCEASTRTQLSFEIAGNKLGASVINLDLSSSSLKKGESLDDTLEVIGAMSPNTVVMRHADTAVIARASQLLGSSVVCAGGGVSAHPSQALLDAFTINQFKGNVGGLKIAMIGDVRHSRVAASNIDVLTKLGAKLTLVGPMDLLADNVPEGCEQTVSMRDALTDADVVMCLRAQTERMDMNHRPRWLGQLRNYKLTEQLFKLAKPDAVLMHPGPVTGENELSASLIKNERSLILDQVRFGIPVRMAILAGIGNGQRWSS